ncbi:DNA/RNA non-specific endonuclease [Lachnospira multipara]|uniref:DNA/RNA non-specific endonuclease n=1 Tax=Lachnospira multipara TaxID=28051 RepID=UPI0003F4F21C|nr:DNA/RNA non-specific endonuclease [Lachnospira multipara]
MKKKNLLVLLWLSLLLLFTPACQASNSVDGQTTSSSQISSENVSDSTSEEILSSGENIQDNSSYATGLDAFDLANVPAYSGSPYCEINGNCPFFTNEEMTAECFESYGELDSLGRCQTCIASIGTDLMPTEKRGNIGNVHPTGWHLVKYAGIDGNYLYNRCHLIGYQLTGENANTRNLITGTRYLNVDGMLTFENKTADYIESTGNHVMYRVTPIFEGDNLLASGVLMEAKSVEDSGAGLSFCVFCYNVQPGITIDYATGDSSGPEFTGSGSSNSGSSSSSSSNSSSGSSSSGSSSSKSAGSTYNSSGSSSSSASSGAVAAGSSPSSSYVLNTNTKKFHRPSCGSVSTIKDSNRQDYTGQRQDLINQGYEPCKKCNP